MYKYLDLVNVMGYDYHGAMLYISKKMRVNDDQTTMGPKVGGMTGAECVAIVLKLIYNVCVQCTMHCTSTPQDMLYQSFITTCSLARAPEGRSLFPVLNNIQRNTLLATFCI